MTKKWVYPRVVFCLVTLFILEIERITEVIKEEMEKSLFVEDLLISCVSTSMMTIDRQMQICLDKIEKWAGENVFLFL